MSTREPDIEGWDEFEDYEDDEDEDIETIDTLARRALNAFSRILRRKLGRFIAGARRDMSVISEREAASIRENLVELKGRLDRLLSERPIALIVREHAFMQGILSPYVEPVHGAERPFDTLKRVLAELNGYRKDGPPDVAAAVTAEERDRIARLVMAEIGVWRAVEDRSQGAEKETAAKVVSTLRLLHLGIRQPASVAP
jgi:hypothetical protein